MIATLVKKLLSLRYSVKIEGLDQLSSAKGVLVLPNHPAEIDPVILSAYLWDTLRPRPVVLETFHNIPPLAPIMKYVKAIPMPDMDFDSGPYKRRRVERAMGGVIEALKEGASILIYPSGRLSVTGEERIGGNSGVYSILQAYPEVDIALVRIRGLYGSIFSKAATGGLTPALGPASKRAVEALLKNLFVLLPKREVTIEITLNPPDFPRNGDAGRINRYLERRYNFPKPEEPTLVSYSFRKEELIELPERPSEAAALAQVPPKIEAKVLKHLAHTARVDERTLKPDTSLGDHLGLDSLTIAELLLWLDREFEVTDIELGELVSVGSVLRAASGQLSFGPPKPEFQVPEAWHAGEEDRLPPELGAATTIPEAFLMAASRFGAFTALGDDKSGIISWSDLKFRVLLLARYFARLPGTSIGLLLPASAGGSIAAMAALVAGKVPVFLNWTAGRRSIEHAIEASGLEQIVTSKAFLDIVQVDLEYLETRFIALEDVKKQMTIWDILAGRRLARESTQQLKIAFGIDRINPNDQAVVLFTSGSEALPKGVPLTHRNILSNVDGILDAFSLKGTDVLLGFLPPFHSFGLTVCTLLPLMTGLRVAYHSNPNESRKIAKAIPRWRVSLMAGTPTFLRSILRAGERSLFSTLRLMVSGAEKAPEDLFKLSSERASQAKILEGYGITECSPVVSVNRPTHDPLGVGRPVGDVEVAIVDPETLDLRPEGVQGLILIRGSSVFDGYLGGSPNPFVTRRGIKEHELRTEFRWYNSGDLGYFENGSIIITGRLKRFIKIGGEMISLGALEEALQDSFPSEDGSPTVAVLSRGVEGEARPALILFTTAETDADAVNEVLQEKGFPHIARISEVRMLETIPVLGSGKTDYQTLKGL